MYKKIHVKICAMKRTPNTETIAASSDNSISIPTPQGDYQPIEATEDHYNQGGVTENSIERQLTKELYQGRIVAAKVRTKLATNCGHLHEQLAEAKFSVLQKEISISTKVEYRAAVNAGQEVSFMGNSIERQHTKELYQGRIVAAKAYMMQVADIFMKRLVKTMFFELHQLLGRSKDGGAEGGGRGWGEGVTLSYSGEDCWPILCHLPLSPLRSKE
ncbi:hypothetical protein KI387_014388 [Taxus chinensis]|uniref:Uncharacterized protein n=1 Tax=Taxus chinensis TaxID=29808 RepID=A0AA38CL45_TAXCH|nr:hypothetical protein KI387_014388 [Taxus chinensis]